MELSCRALAYHMQSSGFYQHLGDGEEEKKNSEDKSRPRFRPLPAV
jgi:hypothetical protein